eukprot:3896844-Prymnesium_polylepis.1
MRSTCWCGMRREWVGRAPYGSGTMRAMANAMVTRARQRPTARAAATAATQRQSPVAAGWQGGPGR